MKSLAIAFMLMLGIAVAALQNTNNPNTEKTQGQTSHNVGNPSPVDRLQTAGNASDQRGPSQAKAESQNKLLLDLGSMPCLPDDQQCRAKEKKRLEVQEERP